MKTYFGILKDGKSFSRVKAKLQKLEISVLGYYPKLRIVKFETDRNISVSDFDFFTTVEEEKDDFSIEE